MKRVRGPGSLQRGGWYSVDFVAGKIAVHRFDVGGGRAGAGRELLSAPDPTSVAAAVELFPQAQPELGVRRHLRSRLERSPCRHLGQRGRLVSGALAVVGLDDELRLVLARRDLVTLIESARSVS